MSRWCKTWPRSSRRLKTTAMPGRRGQQGRWQLGRAAGRRTAGRGPLERREVGRSFAADRHRRFEAGPGPVRYPLTTVIVDGRQAKKPAGCPAGFLRLVARGRAADWPPAPRGSVARPERSDGRRCGPANVLRVAQNVPPSALVAAACKTEPFQDVLLPCGFRASERRQFSGRTCGWQASLSRASTRLSGVRAEERGWRPAPSAWSGHCWSGAGGPSSCETDRRRRLHQGY